MRAHRVPSCWIVHSMVAGLVVVPCCRACAQPSPPPLPEATPASVGLLPDRLQLADRFVETAVRRNGIPGAVLLVARNGSVVLRRAYGFSQLRPSPRPMRVDTLFDLASLTKPLAAAAAVDLLIDEGKIGLDDPVSRYLPEFAAPGRYATVTIRQLLTHGSGLPAWRSFKGRRLTLPEMVREIAALKPVGPPGGQFVYSDLGYVTLGAVVEAVTHEGLDRFTLAHIYEPLGMKDTGFQPAGALGARCAATAEGDTTEDRLGHVHDPTAAALGGVSGNAGLFSTADDIARYAQMLLNGGEYAGVRIFSQQMVLEMISPASQFVGQTRGLGWDLDSDYSIRGAFPSGSFGHTGFTGTSIWIDPFSNAFVVLLTNAVHARPPTRAVLALRRAVSTAVAASIADAPAGPGTIPGYLPRSLNDQVRVESGLDVTEREGFRRLKGRRVAVICNQTSVDRQGRHLIDLLLSHRIQVKALFSPEHGIRGAADEAVENGKDKRTGLPIYSLYDYRRPARYRYRPTPEMLAGVDTLVFDLQDVGVRYYTYLSTLGYMLETAAERHLKIFLLDRPNPLGGLQWDGPLLEMKFGGFAGYHPMPVQYGMTIGELGRLFNVERNIHADLEVVRMRHWNRRLYYDQTGLPWVNPSPNIRNIREAALYPGIGLLENQPISVGRGTDTPFEVIGAPWMDGLALADNLNARRLPGVSFVPTRFTPSSSVYRGRSCSGVQILLWDRRIARPVAMGIHIADALARLFPSHITARTLRQMRDLVGNERVPAAIAAGVNPDSIVASWSRDYSSWARRRARFLLY